MSLLEMLSHLKTSLDRYFVPSLRVYCSFAPNFLSLCIFFLKASLIVVVAVLIVVVVAWDDFVVVV